MSEFWRKFLPLWFVWWRYTKAGYVFGEAASRYISEEPTGFKAMLRTWGKWEKEYSRRGYRTLPLSSFIINGRHKIPLKTKYKKRLAHEEAILHSKVYRQGLTSDAK